LLLDQGFVDGMGWPMQLAVWYAVEDGRMIESVVVGARVRVQFRKHGADYMLVDLEVVHPAASVRGTAK
jgi:hypothetical protein